MPFELPQANLLGTLLELMIYGGYVVIFIEHLRILYRRRSRTWSYSYLQLTSVLLFTLITAHLCVDILRAMQAYTGNMGTPNAPNIFFEDFNTVTSRLRTALYNIITLISDLFLVYRCFILWGSKYSIALIPFLLFLADIGMAVWVTNSLNRAKAGDHFAATLVGLRSKYLFIVTLAENLLCTLLIAYRIWSMQQEMAPFVMNKQSKHQQNLSGIIAIVIESAAIYSAVLIALIITDSVGSSAFFMLLNMVSPIIGMVFSSIIVRSGAANNMSNTTHTSQGASVSGFRFGPNSLGSAAVRSENNMLGSERTAGSGVHVRLETLSKPSYGLPDSGSEYDGMSKQHEEV